MKNMKIKLTGQNNFAVVAQALADAGYHNVVKDSVYEDATELYAYENGLVLKTTAHTNVDGYFDKHKHEEHFLTHDAQGDRFVTKDYWTQPKTPEQRPVASLPKPLLGLRPRHVVRMERSKEILEAMMRYMEAGMTIPKEWLDEFAEINRVE